jgi:hypothetical protein
MSKVITLPSGASVTLRDPRTLKVKDRRKMVEAANNETGLLQNLSMVDGLIAVLIESWTLDLILPSVMLSSLYELSLPDYDTLAAEAQKVESVLFTDFTQDKGADSPLDNSTD